MSKAVTKRSVTIGKKELRLVHYENRFHGLIEGQRVVEGDNPEQVWQELHDEIARSSAEFFGFEGARARFLHFFPRGMHSQGFHDTERDYKLAAKAVLDAGAPLEKAVEGSDLGPVALKSFQKTNLLDRFELMRLAPVLEGADGDTVVRAAAAFALDPNRGTLGALSAVLKPHDAAKWTIATYLPFLWRPDRHMFLKPMATHRFAERVGHPFHLQYKATLSIDVYESLLDLARTTKSAIAAFKPRDMIDIQSFIWAVGNFIEGKDGPYDW